MAFKSHSTKSREIEGINEGSSTLSELFGTSEELNETRDKVFGDSKGDAYVDSLIDSKQDSNNKFDRLDEVNDRDRKPRIEKEEAVEIAPVKPVEEKKELTTEQAQLHALREQVRAQEDMNQAYAKRFENLQHEIMKQAAKPAEVPGSPAEEEFGFVETKDFRHVQNELVQIKQAFQQQAWNQAISNEFHRLKGTADKIRAEYPDFDEHFPEGHLNKVFDQVAKTGNFDYIRNLDWNSELRHAYKAKNYDKVQKELVELKSKQTNSIEKAKATKKENLKLVGKPGSAGASEVTPIVSSVTGYGKGKRGGFKSLSAQFKQQLRSR